MMAGAMCPVVLAIRWSVLLWSGRLAGACLLTWVLAGCGSFRADNATEGVSMTGIDHLADHLSVQDFWVDGRSGFQAGKGGSVVCCARIPLKWTPSASVEVRWEVANWRDGTWRCFRRSVQLEPYEQLGRLYVHFLPDGGVKAAVSDLAPWSNEYPGPRIPIPQKEPWKVYPKPSPTDHCPENEHSQP
jgi:hypothetical protein